MNKNLSILFFSFSVFSSFGQGSWIQKADLPGVSRETAIGFSIGNKGYIGTGDYVDTSGIVLQRDLWEWDEPTNTWTQKADLPGFKRQFAVGFSIGSKGYIATGYDSYSISFKDFWEWDQATNTWSQKTNVTGFGRYKAVGFSIGNLGYVATGIDSVGNTQDLWEWNPSSSIWTQKANFPGLPRNNAVGFSIGAKGYLGTGYIGNSNCTDDFWEYDPGANTWSQKAPFGGAPRAGAVGFSIGNKGYLGTGFSITGLTLYIYIVIFGSIIPHLIYGRRKQTLAVIQDYLQRGLAWGQKDILERAIMEIFSPIFGSLIQMGIVLMNLKIVFLFLFFRTQLKTKSALK